MEIYRDGKRLDGPNGTILFLGKACATLDQSVPLRTESCRDRLLRDHGYAGWVDDHFDVSDIFDHPHESFELEEAVAEINVHQIMAYERVVVLGQEAWTTLHEALNRRSEDEDVDFQNDMCADFQLAGYKWLKILRLPHASEMEAKDEDIMEACYMVYRAFVGLVPDRAAEHHDRMQRDRRAQR